MDKSFWVAKGAERDPTFDNPSRIETKRAHRWLADSGEAEFFSSKKHAVQSPSAQSISRISHSDIPAWESLASFQPTSNQFVDRLFGSETIRPVDFAERSISLVEIGGANLSEKDSDEQFDDDISVGLSISQSTEDPEMCLSYIGIRKVKVNQVKDSETGIHGLKINSFDRENHIDMHSGLAYDRRNEMAIIPMGQTYNKDIKNVDLMRHTCEEYAQIRSRDSTYHKGDPTVVSITDAYKEESGIISFDDFNCQRDIIPLGRSVGGLDESDSRSLLQISKADGRKQVDASNVNVTRVVKSRSDFVSKNKPESKPSRKETPNSFPSNVRSLISTGMLDGVPVKYVSVSREELRGIIKGSGYLCGCQSCNYSKVLNAYEIERHAGCKTKHPNNHIYFENGKTIYQIVQELRSTPESMLFDTIQTVFGAPINQKSFRIWKESYQAATRELQRIYGKEELKL
ncbi:uncharacterized protein LOC115736524 isoform X2 [Rhodamnia argentea]|uniref:Uncharacterized protein LOC115736524 isoform X2 n=1 Tax=Rhodamnia argentea TaxID=178133 RepID=A0A8B8NPM9_9MYRT|nr:uncharacterized protein LOC115736524 isoform X2 [Rhodamnia argentea]